MRRHTIVCLTTASFRSGLWTNKQHIMSRLAARHRVLYVNFGAELAWRVVRRKLRAAPASLATPRSLLLAPAVELDRGVEVLDFATLPKWAFLPVPQRIGWTARTQLALLKRHLKAEGIEDAVIWAYHPAYGGAVSELPHGLIVYDCVDEYGAVPPYTEAPEWIERQEAALCRAADLVFCTSQTLLAAKRPFHPEATYLVENVGDAAHFERALSSELAVPAELAALPRPVIGFTGAVNAEKLDIPWLEALASRRPAYSLVLIGPITPSPAIERLARAPNVHLLGHRDYAALPGYVKGFDVAMIPYALNEYTRGVFPLKFFEFLASGRPLVVSALPALERHYDAVFVARSEAEFVALCDRAFADPEQGRAARIELARNNSWEHRVERLMAHVDAAFERKRATRSAS